MRTFVFPLAFLFVPVAAQAADLKMPTRDQVAAAVAVQPTLLPAVSGINGSVTAAGGAMKGGAIGQIGGSLSIPVAQQFGVQVDGLAAKYDSTNIIGVGGHAFWRDPASMLIGLYAEGVGADLGEETLRKGRFGAEAEYYLNRMTLSGVAGYEWGNLDIRKGLFVETLAGYYATDDLKLSAGYSYGFAGHGGVARVDWQTPASFGLGNATLYGEARFGEHGSLTALAGLKLPLGAAPKSLKRREREDDPQMWVASQPAAIASAQRQGQFQPKVVDQCPALRAAYDAAADAYRDDDSEANQIAMDAARRTATNAGCLKKA